MQFNITAKSSGECIIHVKSSLKSLFQLKLQLQEFIQCSISTIHQKFLIGCPSMEMTSNQQTLDYPIWKDTTYRFDRMLDGS